MAGNSRLANALRKTREARGQTQEQVGEELGTTKPNISRWETGETVPEPPFYDALERYLGVSRGVFSEWLREAHAIRWGRTHE